MGTNRLGGHDRKKEMGTGEVCLLLQEAVISEALGIYTKVEGGW